jgi:hypothetical protein
LASTLASGWPSTLVELPFGASIKEIHDAANRTDSVGVRCGARTNGVENGDHQPLQVVGLEERKHGHALHRL